MQGPNAEYKTQDLRPATEADAQAEVFALAFDTEEDEAGCVETLALEAEARDGWNALAAFGPLSDF